MLNRLDNPPALGLLAIILGAALRYTDYRPGIAPRLPEAGATLAEAGVALILVTALALRMVAHVRGAGLRLDLALLALWRAAGDWSDARSLLWRDLWEDARRRRLAALAGDARRRLLAALEAEDRAAVWEQYTVTENYQDNAGNWHKRQVTRERRVFALRVALNTDAEETVFHPHYPAGFRARSREAWRRIIGQHAAAIVGVLGGNVVLADEIALGGAAAEHDVLIVSFAPPQLDEPVEALPAPEPEPEPEPDPDPVDLDSPVVADGPPLSLLAAPKRGRGRPTEGKSVAERLTRALDRLHKPADVVATVVGPGTVTVTLRPGEVVTEQRDGTVKREPVRATDVMRVAEDLAIALGVEGVRVYADTTAPGCVAVEVPRAAREGVAFREAVASKEFRDADRSLALPLALGLDVRGRPVVADLATAPHILAAGTTGSGKSVAINALICSLLACRTPEQVRLFILDPKQVDFAGYDGLPHLAAPILTETAQGIAVLSWLAEEMERRYGLLRTAGVNNIAKLPPSKSLPRLVFVADEFADLLMAAEGAGGKEGKEARANLERNIARIAQKARAAGIHLILATQRPTANVVTGLLKSNMPTRLALRVNSEIDSRVILDQPGAEALAGKGDALWSPGGAAPVRVQTPFADPDIPALVAWWRERRGEPAYLWPPATGVEQGRMPGADTKDEDAGTLWDDGGDEEIELV